jgi:hypothetical protein
MMSKIGLLLFISFFIPYSLAFAVPEPKTDLAPEAESGGNFETPVGVGILFGTSEGQASDGAVVEGQNHFLQLPDAYHLRRYGEGESRLTIGNGVGVSLSNISGITLFGLSAERPRISPQFGIEPFSGIITLNSNSHSSSYYEWLPMGSVGVQFTVGSCRVLPLVRGGGAVGGVSEPSWVWVPKLGYAYGSGMNMNCSNFDLSGDAIRIQANSQVVDLDVVDAAYDFLPRKNMKFGVRGEREVREFDEGVNHSEYRMLLIFRSRIAD